MIDVMMMNFKGVYMHAIFDIRNERQVSRIPIFRSPDWGDRDLSSFCEFFYGLPKKDKNTFYPDIEFIYIRSYHKFKS